MGKEALILDAASALFLEYGYKKTTLDDIADRLGIQKGGIYYYYKGKEELFIAVLKKHHEAYAKQTIRYVEAEETFKKKLIAYGMAKVEYIQKFSDAKLSFVDDIIGNSNLPSEMTEYFLKWERGFIQKYVLGDKLKATEGETKYKQMVDLIQMENGGIAQLFNVEHNNERLRQTAKYHLTLIATGLEQEMNQGGLL